MLFKRVPDFSVPMGFARSQNPEIHKEKTV